VQLEAMSSYLSSDNPQLVPIRTTLQELRKQLYMMESGKGGKGMLPGDRLHPAMITVPALALDYGRLMRELKVQESLYALLTSQYEQAKLAEARDTPTVQVLDPAVPPERKIRPVIRKNVLISGLLSLLFSVFCTFSWEAIVRWKTRPAVPVPSVS
jgi:tyrosine-protein kinase Etk/Wzc